MSITAIRHLITPWNEQTLLQGTTDVAADVHSDANQRLIKSLKEQLSHSNFDRVLVSPMQRAQQTAKALGFNDYQTTPLVTEMSFGPYEGHPKPTMLQELGSAWVEDPKSTVHSPALNDLEKRIEQLLEEYTASSNWLIVSHGAFIRALWSFTQIGKVDRMNQIEVKNGELVTLQP